ncbi:MAG TPA: 4Fe-4S binding protein [Bacteroidales bacterium]|nr:4Fe-4S binding protein [Bacteroidales bacterium]
MSPLFFNRNHTGTEFIHLDTRKCKACWECLVECPNKVIGKIDLPWHKHALVADPSKCSGCLKCIKACKFGAYSKLENC